MIKLLPSVPTETTQEIDDTHIELLQGSHDTAVKLGKLLDSKKWKYIKFLNMVELERIEGKKICIKLEINIMATVPKIVEFFQDAQKMYLTDKEYGSVDTVSKVGASLKTFRHKMNYSLPGGERDFALCTCNYDLSDGSAVIVKHSINVSKKLIK